LASREIVSPVERKKENRRRIPVSFDFRTNHTFTTLDDARGCLEEWAPERTIFSSRVPNSVPTKKHTYCTITPVMLVFSKHVIEMAYGKLAQRPATVFSRNY
jgi:hypothetical protein